MTPAWPEQLPRLGSGRDVILPLPIEPPPELVTDRVPGSPLVLGYLGRVVREQKRMDRLPALLAALDGAGLKYRFEVIGDGGLRPRLEQRLAGRVQFHGWVSEGEKWRILSRWDAVVFLTDNEGGPIAMLEAMAAGCLPFFPQLHGSLGDTYAPRVDARCHYPSGDLMALAAAVRGVFAEASGAVLARREIARRLVAGHTPESYSDALADFVARIADLPAIAATDPDRGHWSDAWPLGLVNRVAPWLLRRRR
jgi:glycosyltransferase involved in cell wall biosynthesis